ncbi:hypothetical protein HK096_002522, partial [Nowakowskiella sp. JEL0078]
KLIHEIPQKTVTLLPYIAFSTFHTLIYIRNELIPTLFPPTANFALARTVSSQIGQFITKYQNEALKVSAYLEIYLIPPYILIMILFGRASIATPFLYAQFVRFRYFFSPMTKEAVLDLRKRGEVWIEKNEKLPAIVRQAYVWVRVYIEKSDVESNMRAQQQQAQ